MNTWSEETLYFARFFVAWAAAACVFSLSPSGFSMRRFFPHTILYAMVGGILSPLCAAKCVSFGLFSADMAKSDQLLTSALGLGSGVVPIAALVKYVALKFGIKTDASADPP